MRRHRGEETPLSRAIRAAVLGAVVGVPFAGATARAAYYVQPTLAAAVYAAAWNPAAPPPGVNNYACRLGAAHPRPVVLITGTFANMADDFGALGPILANDGYCAFSLNYGGQPGQFIQSIGPVPGSALQVASLIDHVRSLYGVPQVDLVGHSQGGMLAEYVAKVLGYGPRIHTIVGLSPTTHGTTLDGLTNLARYFPGANNYVQSLCPACFDQEAGSSVIATLDGGPIAQPGVGYTILETQYENVVTPVGSAFIGEHGVVDRYVQASCWNDAIDHAGLPYDNTTIRLTLNALSPASAQAPNCWISYPIRGAVQQ
jgi:triacylglycerol esterase/lipase EstA (alpha/beta hydrolase family)